MDNCVVWKETFLGIELGSTRIKSILIDNDHNVIATGSHTWDNSLVDGIWTYSQEEILSGLQASYASLKADVNDKYGTVLTNVGAIGISAMMHGYIALDRDDNFLVPFRTWRNTITGDAAGKLSELFDFNIPERWSISHLYQAILNKEEHVGRIDFLTTLSSLVHYKLTGQKVIGVGDASGMFPIDEKKNFNERMCNSFNGLMQAHGVNLKLESILPRVLQAGEMAGYLTDEGAKLLDVDGDLVSGIPLCPPEGDAGTGMVATNSVRPNTGNVSAGTSVFAMVVLDKALSKRYAEIDVVTTPDGEPVAMVHCNNCTNEISAYAKLIIEATEELGLTVEVNQVYDMLFSTALKGAKDCGGLISYNYLSGESITHFTEGRPMLVRSNDSVFSLSNLMRAQLFSAVATLNIGMKILFKENIKLKSMVGHGGYFKSSCAGATAMALALNTPVTVMQNAGEGGAWGMAILAAFMVKGNNRSLGDYLASEVFMNTQAVTTTPEKDDIEGFEKYMSSFEKGLEVERKAVEVLC